MFEINDTWRLFEINNRDYNTSTGRGNQQAGDPVHGRRQEFVEEAKERGYAAYQQHLRASLQNGEVSESAKESSEDELDLDGISKKMTPEQKKRSGRRVSSMM